LLSTPGAASFKVVFSVVLYESLTATGDVLTGTISKASHARSTPEVGVEVFIVTAVPAVAVTLLFSITAAVSIVLV
jgi:hypothetical protein